MLKHLLLTGRVVTCYGISSFGREMKRGAAFDTESDSNQIGAEFGSKQHHFDEKRFGTSKICF